MTQEKRVRMADKSLEGEEALLTAVDIMLARISEFSPNEISIDALNEFYDGDLNAVQITQIINRLTHLQVGATDFLLKVLDETGFETAGTIKGANGEEFLYDVSLISEDS